jgi:hypothetical protein
MLEQSFSSYFLGKGVNSLVLEETEGINKHLTHLEELILTRQKQGLDSVLVFVDELLKVFSGNVDSKIFTTVKYDGAPAVIAGYNPENNKFFVATKSIAAKTPKVNYTEQDIETNHGQAPGLVEKLKLCLRYLPNVIKQGIYQGDLMFDKTTLKVIDIEGEKLVTFKPNTITYAVPADSDLGKRVLNSQLGIIFHTKYTGSSLTQLSKSPDVNVSEFNQTPEVFVDDAKFKDMSGTVTLTEDEETIVKNNIEQIKNASTNMDWLGLPGTFYMLANTFINSLIRSGSFVTDPDKTYDDFITWYDSRIGKEIEKLKSETGKQKRIESKNKAIEFFNTNKQTIVNIFFVTQKIEEIKRIFISKYNTAIKTKQFITQPDGSLKVTAPEGYVAVDHEGNMVKLVDRLEFSKANFAISKGDKFK